MGFLVTRAKLIGVYATELVRQGLPPSTGPIEREAVFILDGVGGFQFMPLLIRRVIREENWPLGTIWYRWQCGLPVEIWTDLMWHSRNRRQAECLADRISRFRENHPSARIHIVAYSGGCGVAVFACEKLQSRALVDTMVLACPAISPTYNLAPALRAVTRCYALFSGRDNVILGLGTTVFGTVDRRFTRAAGMTGFTRPGDLSVVEAREYEKLRQIEWSPALRKYGHRGGHTGWANLPFLREHLMPLLRGEPKLPLRECISKETSCRSA